MNEMWNMHDARRSDKEQIKNKNKSNLKERRKEKQKSKKVNYSDIQTKDR